MLVLIKCVGFVRIVQKKNLFCMVTLMQSLLQIEKKSIRFVVVKSIGSGTSLGVFLVFIIRDLF